MKKRLSFRSIAVTLTALCVLSIFASGCRKVVKNEKVDVIRIVHGNDQNAMPGEKFAEVVKIELLSANQKGLLGGKGSRQCIADCVVEIPTSFAPPVVL